MTEAKSSKRTRRAERREQGAGPEPGRSQPSDTGATTPDTSEPERAGTTTQVIRDRNLRLREQAAAQRRSKREREQRTATASGLDASERVDDVLARSTHAVVMWLKRHFTMVQWVVVLLVVTGITWQIYSWRIKKTRARNADVLAEGLGAEFGQIKDSALEGDDEKDYPSALPSYPDHKARLAAAATEYKQAIELTPESGPGRLAALGLASVLFEQGKFDEALTRYRAVAAGPLAKSDPDVRGRALEGIGLSLESKNDLDGALRQFGRLASMDQPGLKALGLYHEARAYYLKGDKEKAKARLGKAQEQLKKLVKPEDQQRSYLAGALRELGTAIDPASSAAGFSAEASESLQRQLMSDPQRLQRMLEDIKRNALQEKAPALPTPEQEAAGEPAESSEAPAPAKDQTPAAPTPAKAKPTAPKAAAEGQGASPPKAAGSAPAPEPVPATGSDHGNLP